LKILTDWLEILTECAKQMKEEALKIYGLPEAAVGSKLGAGGDISKKIDLVAENKLIDLLDYHNISCILISEEAGQIKIGHDPPEYYVITDPIDGTTNATRGLPFSAIVIAFSKGPNIQDVETAIVSDIFHESNYTAQKMKGSFLNNKKIVPSKTTNLEDAVIGVDFNSFNQKEIIIKLSGLLKKSKHLRHFGANALEICYVADGSTDGFIDIRGKLRITDIVASYLILKEAGGIMLTPEGKEIEVPLNARQRVSFIAAPNIKMYQTIKEVLDSNNEG